ncbi:MAG: nucleoside kinase [Chloroflexi bacterium]|nr:nucleoside kinase [Chloroflexota bacterium]MCC6895633.1 nucleoside kinase [Anaerolineae bacterium]
MTIIETEQAGIHRVEARKTVQATIRTDLILEAPIGTTIEALLIEASKIDQRINADIIMGGIVDGKLRELTFPITRDVNLTPVMLSSSDGGRIYRRSLVMLMATAADELWPGIKVSVSYAIPEGGFYCKLIDRAPFDQAELEQLDQKMREIVAKDDPINKRIAGRDEAAELFAARDEDDKVRLLEQRRRTDLTLYDLRGREDYYYGYMLSSTRYLRTFRLILSTEGFILQYPRKENPTELPPIEGFSKLVQVFTQANVWLERMGVKDIGRLNQIVRENRAQEIILVAEALQERLIAQIARDVWTKHHDAGVQLVLIAGPSSSGKTTFSKRLAIQLLAHGLQPFTLEMDMYFVDRERTPRDANGDYDFESLHAINLHAFNHDLLQLMAGEATRLAHFDFIKGKSGEGPLAQLKANQIIIVEGIHGLNPGLVPDIPAEKIFRIYVSALTQLNTDIHNRVSTTDVRLLRRIVRDAQHRGYSATDTILRWPSVRRGEKQNIFPYQENAEALFNSALVYELAALRPLAEPLLLQVEPATPAHLEANRLLSFMRWVQPLSAAQQGLIPDTSLIREFIGGSILDDYLPGSIHRTT